MRIELLIVLSIAIACGGGAKEATKEPKSRFSPVVVNEEIVGYNFTLEDGSVLFIPIDEMPPVAPDGLEKEVGR